MEAKLVEIDLEVNAIIESNRRSFSETPNDILRRMLLSSEASAKSNAPHSPASIGATTIEAPPGARTTGRWTVDLLGQRYPAPSLKEAYREALLRLGEAYPRFLEEFAREGGRSRKFVATAPRDLYLSSPHLAAKHAAPLRDGWFFDTNLSTDQVARRVRAAARVCGLSYGKDFQLLNNLAQI